MPTVTAWRVSDTAGHFIEHSFLLCLFFLRFLFQFVISQGSLDCIFGQHGAVQFHGGRQSSLAMSVFLMVKASSTVLPFTHSVAKELEAIADPQPNVLNLASTIFPFSST